ncbi:MAG: amino acid-binding protein [Magnetococcales bacterium]|nr:amino acid-binding protein [Magnetococcales bacterium]
MRDPVFFDLTELRSFVHPHAMNQRALLTVAGRDRPGIVARTTQVLFETGCNIADSSMTQLGGAFTVMLVLHLPPALSCAALAARLQPLVDAMRLTVHVHPLEGDMAANSSANRAQKATLSLLGADQPGIVFRTTQLLAEMGCNITDLYTRVLGSAERPVYSMVIEVESSDSSELPPELHPRLAQLEKQLNVEINLRIADSSLM